MLNPYTQKRAGFMPALFLSVFNRFSMASNRPSGRFFSPEWDKGFALDKGRSLPRE